MKLKEEKGGMCMDMDERNTRAIAREKIRGNWGKSVLAGFLAYWLGGLIAGTNSINLNILEDVSESLPAEVLRIILILLFFIVLIALVNFIIGGTIQLGYARFLLNQHDGKNYSVKDLFSQFHRFGTGFSQAFLTSLYVILWTMLFIVPGLIKAYSYAMTPFILADHPEMTADEAITASRNLMDGHKGELFVLGLSFFGWNLLCVFTLGIASLWVTPYINAAYAAFYRKLTAAPQQLPTGYEEV